MGSMRLDHPEYDALYRYTRVLSVALGYRDLYTRVHSERVLSLAESMGMRVSLPQWEMAVLRIASVFHDIGKIGIPDHILLKPSRLDESEAAAMRRHSAVGAEIILATELEEAEAVARVIRHHHENFDGSGYPDMLTGEGIPLCSRIIGIADSYDAMAATRSYHRAKSHREILAILREETGKKHDPALMEIFLDIVERSEYRATDGPAPMNDER